MRAAKATDLSSIPSVAHITASSVISLMIWFGSHLTRLDSIFSPTVKASSPYIIVKLKAVVSYIIDEPFFNLFCLSSNRTASSMSASNSNIAAIRGASGWRLGIIMLPEGIVYES